MKYIYIHGGPGLSSKAEEMILKDETSNRGLDIEFWNEPRQYITDKPYNELTESLIQFISRHKEKVVLIGHSSGCLNILNILPKITHKVSSIVFLAPAIDLDKMDKNIIKFALNIYKKSDDLLKEFNQLTLLEKKVSNSFDQYKIDALMLSFASNYFLHNFKSEASFINYFSHLTGDYAFNLDNFFKIRQDISKNNLSLSLSLSFKSDLPLITIYGENDPIIKMDETQESLSKIFSNNNSLEVKSVAHCPHIDATEEFIDCLIKLKQ